MYLHHATTWCTYTVLVEEMHPPVHPHTHTLSYTTSHTPLSIHTLVHMHAHTHTQRNMHKVALTSPTEVITPDPQPGARKQGKTAKYV